jgi:uncharacterized Zn finger protein
MLKDWIDEKEYMPCKKCNNKHFVEEFSDKKIKRYALRCAKCNKFIAWIPKCYEDEIKEIKKIFAGSS